MTRTQPISIVDYSRQAELDASLGIENIRAIPNIIVGCGGIGFWTALFLALMGVECVRLIEGGRIDESNLNRLPFPQGWVGRNKAVALRRILWSIRPEMTINVIQKHISQGTLKPFLKWSGRTGTIVWDCTDDARIQKKIYKFCKEQGCVYTKIGYEGMGIGNYRDYDVWFDEATYQPGYRTSNANAITSSISAGIGLFSTFLERAGEQGVGDININLKKLILEGKA